MRQLGAVGDMMGYDFIDLAGQPAPTPFAHRVIGLSFEDLVRIPNVIAVASEIPRLLRCLAHCAPAPLTRSRRPRRSPSQC